MRWKCSALFFFNLPQERFIGQRWSLWPSFVLPGSLWTPSQAAEGEEASQTPILSGTSFSVSSSHSTPAVGSLTGPTFQPAQCSGRAGQRLQANRGSGQQEQRAPGTPRCHIHPQRALGRRGVLGMLQSEELCRLGGLPAGPWPGEAPGWERGWGAAGAQPGGPSWAQPRAARLAGCRRPAGLGAGRLSIFSEGFIEWIPAVWLHTEILS